MVLPYNHSLAVLSVLKFVSRKLAEVRLVSMASLKKNATAAEEGTPVA